MGGRGKPLSEDPRTLAPVAKRARDATAADAVILVAKTSRGGTFVPISADGLAWDLVLTVHRALTKANADLRRGELVNISDLGADPRTSSSADWRAYGFKSVLAAPLLWDDAVLGGIYALNPGIPIDTDDAVYVIQGLARHAAVVVANMRLRRRAARLSHEVQSILALDEVVLAAHDVEEMDKALLAAVAPLTGAVTGGIMVWDEERAVLRMLPGAFGVSEDDAVSCQVSTDHPTSNTARVFATGKSYMSNDARGDPAQVQDYVDLFHVERILTVPLSLGGRRIGVVHLANKPTPFTQDDLQTAEMLAPRIATLVELGQALLRLHHQQRLTASLVDLAVGIASGGTMQALAPRALARVGRSTGMNALALAYKDAGPIVWSSGDNRRELNREWLARAMDHEGFREEIIAPQGPGDPGRSTIHVPVRLEGAQIATLVAVRNRAEPFVDHERDGFVRLANITALAWATERNRQQRAELARLQERQRIADDLHDTVSQILFVAQMNLESVLESGGVTSATARTISHARGLLLKGDAEIRNVIHELSRPVQGDLAHRLAALIDELRSELNVNITLEVTPKAAETTSEVRGPVADAIIKTAREAVVNAAKHAAPNTVSVQLLLGRRSRLRLVIADDGLGIANGKRSDGKGHGLAAVRRVMREQGGLVRIGRGPDGGTKVTASIEVQPARSAKTVPSGVA
jgi:signal transduction histidine kinase